MEEVNKWSAKSSIVPTRGISSAEFDTFEKFLRDLKLLARSCCCPEVGTCDLVSQSAGEIQKRRLRTYVGVGCTFRENSGNVKRGGKEYQTCHALHDLILPVRKKRYL